MVETVIPEDVAALPLAPRSPLPYLQRLRTVRDFHTGPEVLRDAGGPVTRHRLAPAWIFPEVVVTTSPQGMHDVLDRPHTFVEKRLPFLTEQQRLGGDNIFNVEHDKWLPRVEIETAILPAVLQNGAGIVGAALMARSTGT